MHNPHNRLINSNLSVCAFCGARYYDDTSHCIVCFASLGGSQLCQGCGESFSNRHIAYYVTFDPRTRITTRELLCPRCSATEKGGCISVGPVFIAFILAGLYGIKLKSFWIFFVGPVLAGGVMVGVCWAIERALSRLPLAFYTAAFYLAMIVVSVLLCFFGWYLFLNNWT